MSNIFAVAEKRSKIMAAQNIYCPSCNGKQFSPFDKLFTKAYDICADCIDAKKLDKLSDNIFALL